jgi:hypothetical protein
MDETTNRSLLGWLLTIAFLAVVIVLAFMNAPRNTIRPASSSLNGGLKNWRKMPENKPGVGYS